MNKITSLTQLLNRNYRAIIFDCYGTLVEIQNKTNPYKYLLEVLTAQGKIFEDYKHFVMCENKTLNDWIVQKEFSLTPEQEKRFYELLTIELNSIQCYPETLNVLNELRRQSVKTLICSNLAKPYGQIVQSLPVEDSVLSYEIGYLKPEKEIFEFCHQKIGFDKNEILFVGDTPSSDYEGSKKYGFDAYLIQR